MPRRRWNSLVIYAPNETDPLAKSSYTDTIANQTKYIELLEQTYKKGTFYIATAPVQTRADLRFELDRVREHNKNGMNIDMVHFLGHSTEDGNGIHLTRDDVDLTKPAGLDMFKDINVECLLFSCCDLGSKDGLIHRIQDRSNASLVLAYKHLLNDHDAYMADSITYHLLWGQKVKRTLPLKRVVENLKDTIESALLYGKDGPNPLAYALHNDYQ